MSEPDRTKWVGVRPTDPAGNALPVRIDGQATVTNPLYVVALPYGGTSLKGNVTTTNTWQAVISHKVTDGKTLHLTKLLISCDQDFQFRFVWDGQAISAEHYHSKNTPFPDWYGWNSFQDETLLGDGVKTFEVQVQYPSGGSGGDCQCDLEVQET